MKQNEIESNLCIYDVRSDDYIRTKVIHKYSTRDMQDIKTNHCCCLNCNTGRNKLALEIIRLNKRIIKLKGE